MKFAARDSTVFGCILLLGAIRLAAQEPPTIGFGPMNMEFLSGPIAFDTEPVTEAPYSAEAVTEIVQTLADGNRIVRESTAQISRDSKGRTRREQGLLAMFGPLVGGFAGPGGPRGPAVNDAPRQVQISDPTTRTTIMLDPQARVAHKMPTPEFTLTGATRDHFEIALPPPPSGVPHTQVQIFRSEGMIAGGPADQPAVEGLGTQFMEGVSVEGTRTTQTIPAGQIGNELPIQVVAERWFSPELKVLVVSRQSDPRFGVTTYRLTNITRSEPPPELFEVPSDFKLIEPGTDRNVIIERRVITK